MATYGPYKPTVNNAPVQGPGLGWNKDVATYNNAGSFSGIANTQGQVQGANTGGGGGGQFIADGQTFNDRASYDSYKNSVSDATNQVRNDINSGYDAYFGQLDQMMGNLPSQRQGQEQIVDNSYKQGVSDLTAQKDSSMGDLNTQRRKTEESQVKSLNDIADNIRNLFQAGNVMLGSKGAGDSSAANQYSYAVTKLGSKQRGDVLTQSRSIESDIQDRESKLNNIFTQESTKLKTERDNNILQVAQFFQDKQNELLQAKASGQLQRGQSLAQLSTQLLQQAQQQLMQADADFRNRSNTLQQWAMNNSTTIQGLKSNLASVGQYDAPAVQAGAMNGAPQFDAGGNMSTAFYGGGGARAEDKYKLNNPFNQNIL